MVAPYLVVLAGQPGTGKTTLARLLAEHLRAAYLRVDAVETAILRSGLGQPPIGPVGYAVVHEIAAATLALGTPVVVDAVNPVPEARAAWRSFEASARLVVFETVLADPVEHRRRVEARQPDLVGQTVPTWAEVQTAHYAEWDDARDGPRHLIDMTDANAARAAALSRLGASPRGN